MKSSLAVEAGFDSVNASSLQVAFRESAGGSLRGKCHESFHGHFVVVLEHEDFSFADCAMLARDAESDAGFLVAALEKLLFGRAKLLDRLNDRPAVLAEITDGIAPQAGEQEIFSIGGFDGDFQMGSRPDSDDGE